MGHVVIYKGEMLSDSFLDNSIASMVTTIRKNDIKPGDVVICRANTPLGVYLHWVACCKLNLLPAFVPSDFSLESIYAFNTSINFYSFSFFINFTNLLILLINIKLILLIKFF